MSGAEFEDPADMPDESEEDMMNPRMCIVSRERLATERLIRFVAAPDGTVVADLKRRLPGRGAHVEARRDVVEKAVQRKLFRRALKVEVVGTERLADDVDAALSKAALGSLAMARKAGQLVAGSAKADASIRSGRAIAVLHASDAAADGVRKLDAARWAAGMGDADGAPAFRPFTADEMGLAFGGGNVVHAAVLAGEAGAALVMRLEALAIYRGERPGVMTGLPDGPKPTATPHDENGAT